MVVVVVAAVGSDALGSSERTANTARTPTGSADEWDDLGDVVALPDSNVQASGSPVASTRRSCLEQALERPRPRSRVVLLHSTEDIRRNDAASPGLPSGRHRLAVHS